MQLGQRSHSRLHVRFMLTGEIISHFDDADTCLVRFTDGDEKELDRAETLHAIQLYQHKFS